MPYRPKTPCHHPGCPELVEAGRLYCEKHLPLHPEVTRPAAKRGYNRRWQKARKSYLEAHPLCVQCAKQGKEVKTDTLNLQATPLANGYVKAKTGTNTTDDVYNKWYDAVYEPQAEAVDTEDTSHTEEPQG